MTKIKFEEVKFNKNYAIASLLLVVAALAGIIAWQFQQCHGDGSRALFAYGSTMIAIVGSILHKFKKYAEDKIITASEWEDLGISAVIGFFTGLVVVLGVLGWNVNPEPAVYGVSFLGGFGASSVTHGILEVKNKKKK